MSKTLRWVLAGAIVLGLVGACTSPTSTRFPTEEEEHEDPDGQPGETASLHLSVDDTPLFI